MEDQEPKADYVRTYDGKPCENPQSQYHKIYNAKIKMMVMEKYGGKCNGCGDQDLAAMSIDHMTDIATKDKIKNDRTGLPFYKKLLREDVRTDLQILCMSCQMRKRLYGPDITLWQAKREEYERSIKDFTAKINLQKTGRIRGIAAFRQKRQVDPNHQARKRLDGRKYNRMLYPK